MARPAAAARKTEPDDDINRPPMRSNPGALTGPSPPVLSVQLFQAALSGRTRYQALALVSDKYVAQGLSFGPQPNLPTVG